ncbi:MAG: hypothetical protein MK073_01635 [Phycisphaerales bacterium]|nr:hypothetical protein [Phycisphaerales bacterium]
MKQKDTGVMFLFVTTLTVIIWLWAAGQTKTEATVTTTVRFKAPEGMTSTVTPSFASVTLTLEGPRSAVDTAKAECANGLDLTVAETDGTVSINDIASKLNALDELKTTGATTIAAEPSSFNVDIQTMVQVEAAVEAVLSNVTVSGDVTVNPATVTLNIPKRVRATLPDAITVQAVVSDSALQQLSPGVVHTRDAAIRLPIPLDVPDVTVSPSRVEVTFKIQSMTEKTVIPQVRVILAGPPEDYASYTVELPRKTISNVTVEGDNDIIDGIKSGDYAVFAVIRLASRDMEQGISSKPVTSFIAIGKDGVGHQLDVSVEDPDALKVELNIAPVSKTES